MNEDSSKEVAPEGDIKQKDKVNYKSDPFIYILVGVLGLLLLNNLLVLFQTGGLFNLLPITVQSIILYLVITKHKWVRLAVRLWAVLMMLGGGIKLLGFLRSLASHDPFGTTATSPEVSMTFIFMMVFQLAVGCIYFFLTKRYIEAY